MVTVQSTESFREQVERVIQMSSESGEGEIWDLSPNDQAALSAVLQRLAVLDERSQFLRAALVGLVGADTREELEQMEVYMRITPAPAEDKARTIDAIHALLRTLEQPDSGLRVNIGRENPSPGIRDKGFSDIGTPETPKP